MERSEVEIVVGLIKSSPARHRPMELRTTWIEPLSHRIVTEMPGEIPESTENNDSRYQHLLPVLATEKADIEEAVRNAQARVMWLEKELRERDRKITELTQGIETNSEKKAS